MEPTDLKDGPAFDRICRDVARRNPTCTVTLTPKMDYTDALRLALRDHTWAVDDLLVTQLETITVIADERQAIATPVSRTELIEMGEFPMACGDFRLRLLTDVRIDDGSYMTTYEVVR